MAGKFRGILTACQRIDRKQVVHVDALALQIGNDAGLAVHRCEPLQFSCQQCVVECQLQIVETGLRRREGNIGAEAATLQ